MIVIVLKYPNGTYVSYKLSANERGVQHAEGVDFEEARIFEDESIANRCINTLEEFGYKTIIEKQEMKSEIVKKQLFKVKNTISNLERNRNNLIQMIQNNCEHKELILENYIGNRYILICKECDMEIMNTNNVLERIEYLKNFKGKLYHSLGYEL
jgi:hypothetical protein